MPKTKTSEKEFIPLSDRLPQEEELFSHAEEKFLELASYYGFKKAVARDIEEARIFQPLFKAEFLEERPFLLSKTKGGSEIAIKPPAVLSFLRSYVLRKIYDTSQPLKFSFASSSFFLDPRARAETIKAEPEFSLLMLDEKGPIAEVEMLFIIWKTVEELGILQSSLELRVGATGCLECRSGFRSALNSYLRVRITRMCRNCRRHFKKAPTKIFKCEDEKCKMVSGRAPQVLDFLCEMCKKHLRGFLEFLDEFGIPYFLDSRLFREGSWLTHMVFELLLKSEDMPGGENSKMARLAEGGRMSKAAELITGRPLDAASARLFYQPLAQALRENNLPLSSATKPKVFLTHLGELAKRKSFAIMEMLRLAGIGVEESLGRDSIKSQLKIAEREQAQVALILGQKEAIDKTIIVRELDSGIQETIPQEKMIDFLKRKLKK